MLKVHNRGNCATCKDTLVAGNKYDTSKQYNCSSCGYFQNYNQVLVYVKRGIITEVLG